MKKNAIFCFIILSIYLNSCKKDPDTNTDYYFDNKSTCNLKIIKSKSIDTFYLKNNEVKLLYSDYEHGTNAVVPFYYGDSARVYFNDTISILHSVHKNNQAKRKFYKEENFVGGKVKEGYFKYTYTFTEADYQEALKLYDSIHKR